jgi:hypothetical protein
MLAMRRSPPRSASATTMRALHGLDDLAGRERPREARDVHPRRGDRLRGAERLDAVRDRGDDRVREVGAPAVGELEGEAPARDAARDVGLGEGRRVGGEPRLGRGDEAGDVARPAARHRELANRLEPAEGRGREEPERGLGAPAGGRVLAAPPQRLGGRQVHLAEGLAARPGRDGRVGAHEHAREVVALERLPHGRREVRQRAGRRLAEPEVLGERERIVEADLLEPLAREPVPERAVGFRERRVRRLAHALLAERVLGRREARLGAGLDPLALHELAEPLVERRARRRPEHVLEAVAEERGAEHARAAEHAPRVRLERLDARLQHREHRLRQRVAAPLGDGAEHLLEVEGVAARVRRGPLDHGVGREVAEHGARELLGRSLRERRELHGGDGLPREEPGERRAHLGPREREHEQRPVGEVHEQRLDEAHGGEVAPLQVLEHEDDGVVARLAGEQVLAGAADLVAHQHRVLARGAELDRALGGREAQELADELEHAIGLGRRDDAEHALAQLGAPVVLRARRVEADEAREGEREQAPRRSGADGIAARREHGGRVLPLLQLAQELEAQARFALAGGARDEDGARDRLVDALAVEAEQQAELAIAADEGRRAAEQGARRAGLGDLAHEAQHLALALDAEARAEEPGRDVVDEDARGARAVTTSPDEQRGRGVDHRADGGGAVELRAARREGDGRPVEDRAERERAARRAHREVGRGARRAEHGRDRAVGEERDARLAGLRDRAQAGGHRVVERLAHRARRARLHERRGVVARLRPEREQAGRRVHEAVGGRQPQRAAVARVAIPSAGARRARREHHGHEPLLARREPAARRARRRDHRARHPSDRAERRRHRGAVPEALGRAAREHLREEIVELGRHVRADLAEARRLLERDLREQRDGVAADEGRAPREAAEEHAAERVHVRARVDATRGAGLLRRHVRGRAEREAGAREVAAVVRHARDAEVEELRAQRITPREHDVAGLQVAVDDAARVRRAERLGDALREAERVRERERLAAEASVEVLAVDPLHREERLAVREHAVGVVLHDRRVIERGEHVGLAGEARDGGRRRVVEDLHGDARARRAIVGLPDDAHPAAAGEAREDEAVADDVARLHVIAQYRRAQRRAQPQTSAAFVARRDGARGEGGSARGAAADEVLRVDHLASPLAAHRAARLEAREGGLDRRLDRLRRAGLEGRAGQREEGVARDARAHRGEALGERDGGAALVGRLAREAEQQVDVGPEARGDRDLDRPHDVADRVASPHRLEHALRPGLRADDEGVVVAVPGDDREGLGRHVLRPDLRGERAEVHLARRPDRLAHGGEERLHGGEVRRLALGAVRERRRRHEAHVGGGALGHRLDVRPHVRDRAVPEARLEGERRLAEGARVDAAARDLDRVPSAVAHVEGGEGVEGMALGGPVRHELAPRPEVRDAAERARIAALRDRREELHRGRLALADRREIEARPQHGERVGRRVHAARDVERALARRRAHGLEIGLRAREIDRVERPEHERPAPVRARAVDRRGDLARRLREHDVRAARARVGVERARHHVERHDARAHVHGDDERRARHPPKRATNARCRSSSGPSREASSPGR